MTKTVALIIFIVLLIIFVIVTALGIILEKRNYNKGICKYCGKPLRHFDTDSQGGRLYTCPDFCSLVAVSYNCVDKN